METPKRYNHRPQKYTVGKMCACEDPKLTHTALGRNKG